MYTQFFGNFLLNKGIISQEQLLTAIEKQSSTHVKLGALAMHAGYMTAAEVEQIFVLQTRRDMRFGELAVEQGFMTQEQVEDLLKQQLPEYILLGQILVDDGLMTPVQLETLVTEYRSEYELYDLDMNYEQKDAIHHLLEGIDFEGDDIQERYLTDYLLLLFNNIIRFIGNDFTPLNILKLEEVPTYCCTTQNMESPVFQVSSALDMDVETAIHFASRYANEVFNEFDDYVRASMEDFLNLHNGLFLVNMSNDYSIEITLLPPTSMDNVIFSSGQNTYLFPILFPFGMVNFICSVHDTANE